MTMMILTTITASQEISKAPIFYTGERKDPKNRYGYIANLCVAKSARRQGIARNMLHFAIESAISDGDISLSITLGYTNLFMLSKKKKTYD